MYSFNFFILYFEQKILYILLHFELNLLYLCLISNEKQMNRFVLTQ